MPNLTLLNLSFNVISKIQGVSHLHQLLELNLADNCIESIENIFELKRLESLNLSGNQITRIPPSISELKQLTVFRISRNELDVVKDLALLSPLSRLRRLRIDQNPISSLSHTNSFAIFSLPTLEVLNGEKVSLIERDDANSRFRIKDIIITEKKNDSSKSARENTKIFEGETVEEKENNKQNRNRQPHQQQQQQPTHNPPFSPVAVAAGNAAAAVAATADMEKSSRNIIAASR